MSTILGISEIQKILPYRYPFLMIDRVLLHENTTELTAIKNVTTNEVHFSGHFPGNPIMPGVMQLEAIIQAGSIAYKNHRGCRSKDKILILKGVDKVRFKSPIIPGDQLIIATQIDQITDDGCTVKATCKANGVLKSQATITIAYLDEKQLVPQNFTTTYKSSRVPENSPRVFNVNDIATYIPHRFPFQLIDTVIYRDGDQLIIGEKLVSANEPFATAYVPNSPFMPNTMILEIAAQLGCVDLLSREEHRGKLGLFLSIEDGVIHRPAVPGDLLVFESEFIYFKSVMGKAIANVYCGEELLANFQIAFALTDGVV